jgi:glycosyltransferase involved in cell wall biosynthesis
MRIALDCRCVFRGMGGIGRYTWSLLHEYASLDRANDYVCYFTHLEPPAPIRLPGRFCVRTFEAGMIDERFDHLILPTALEEDRIDLYHNPTFAVPIVRTGARTVATVHDAVFRRHPTLVEPRLRNYLDQATRRSSLHADHLITVSEFSRVEICGLYAISEERITAIPNGVHLPEPEDHRVNGAAAALSTKGLDSGMYVLYVGSVEPKKNIDVLLLAFKAVSDRQESRCLRLAIAGSRGAAGYPLEERISELGLRERVVILGHVPEEALEALYRHALVFVYPSLYEGFGFPPLEAMARGIPTIVSDASSLPEVVGEDALRVDPRDPELFAQAILGLLSDSTLRDQLSRRGRERAGKFTWRRSAEKHLAVYQSVMSEKHETHPSRL